MLMGKTMFRIFHPRLKVNLSPLRLLSQSQRRGTVSNQDIVSGQYSSLAPTCPLHFNGLLSTRPGHLDFCLLTHQEVWRIKAPVFPFPLGLQQDCTLTKIMEIQRGVSPMGWLICLFFFSLSYVKIHILYHHLAQGAFRALLSSSQQALALQLHSSSHRLLH